MGPWSSTCNLVSVYPNVTISCDPYCFECVQYTHLTKVLGVGVVNYFDFIEGT